MHHNKTIKWFLIVAYALSLSACGGSGGGVSYDGGGNSNVPVPTTLQNSGGAQQLTIFSASGAPVQVARSTSTFGEIDLTGANQKVYAASLPNGNIVGLETAASGVPATGIFTYTGGSTAVINDGDHFYDIIGNAVATLTFVDKSSGDLDVTLSGFNGDRTAAADGKTTQGTFSAISITWQNASLCNSTQFCNGTVSVLGTSATTTSSATVDNEAALFGSNGQELGGIIDINEPGVLEATTSFVVAQ
jgi:hypothetical protein